jgi:hypothetical protein
MSGVIKPYRGMTPEEDSWTNPQTPRKIDVVRIACTDGVVENATVEFEDGTPLRNVIRVVISLESPLARGPKGETPDGNVYAFISQFHNEIGRVIYSVAEAVVG